MSQIATVSSTGMSSFGSTTVKDNKQASFWKKNAKTVPGSIKPVYGAQHPPIQEMPQHYGGEPSTPKRELRNKQRDSFQDFQAKTSDAWDDGDDDLITMASMKMSLKDVHETAMQVINNHSQQMKAANSAKIPTPEPSPGYKTSDVPAFVRLKENLESHSNDDATTKTATNNSPARSFPVQPNNPHSGPGVGVRILPNSRKTKSASAVRFGCRNVPDREMAKMDKFKSLLKAPSIDLAELKNLCWSGIPREFRPVTWKILSGYLPPILDRQGLTLQRKRQEYFNYVEQYYGTRHQEHHETFRQIQIDIPRMSPLIPLFQQKVVQEIFERILYIWAIRHPASGYVQGINDLVTPFFVIFLSEFIDEEVPVEDVDVSTLSDEHLRIIEADSFWCFSKLLDGIQDNYTFAQPGIQLKVNALKELISRIDNHLHKHLEDQNVEYLQFSFRWMNNLLMRELPLHCTIRLWDTYMSEMNDFATFHLYVCAALLTKFSQDLLRERDFQGLMLMLQNLPTHHWGNEEIGLLLAEAYRLKYMFADAPKHLAAKK